MSAGEKPKKAMIDQIVEEDALEAQVHFLYADPKRLLGTYGVRRLKVSEPDPQEAASRPDQLGITPPSDIALPLWVNFYRYEATGNRGTDERPRYTTIRHSVGSLAVHTGFGTFEAVQEVAEQVTLPPALRLWLDYYQLDKSRNGAGGRQHPVPGELFGLLGQYDLDQNLAAFRQQVPNDGVNDLHFLARYIQSIIASAEAKDPRIVTETPFWQEIQAKVHTILHKNSPTPQAPLEN